MNFNSSYRAFIKLFDDQRQTPLHTDPLGTELYDILRISPLRTVSLLLSG